MFADGKCFVLRFDILSNGFNKLLVDCRTLDNIHCTAVTHDTQNISVLQIFYYGYDRETGVFRL